MKRGLMWVLVVLMLVLAGCGGAQPAAETKAPAAGGEKPAAKGPIKIGAVYPLTGSLALLGEESWRGAEIARIVRNKAGGIGGAQIEYVKADAPDANAAKSEAERLITKENLKVLLGTYSSSLSLTATEVAERNGAVFFELGAISDPITGRGYQNIYRTNPTASNFAKMQIKFTTEFLAAQIGVPKENIKLAIAHEDSSYGTTVAKYVSDYAKEAGIKSVMIEPYNSKAVDLSPVILKLKNAAPDVLIAVSYANDAILFWRQAKEANFNVKAFIGTGGGHTLSDFYKGVGADVEGVYNVDFTQYAVNTKFTPGLDEFVKLYKETFKEDPRSGHSLTNFMGALVLFDVLEKAGGKLDAESVRKAAMAMDVAMGKTATGWGVKFDQTGQNTRGDALVTQWTKDGKLVTVWPKDAAVQDPIKMKTWAERK